MKYALTLYVYNSGNLHEEVVDRHSHEGRTVKSEI